MKKVLIVLGVVVLIALISKPSDQSCIDGIKDKISSQINQSNQNKFFKGAEELLTAIGGQYIFRVEDNILYKNIYIIGTNRKIGFGCFGMVFPSI